MMRFLASDPSPEERARVLGRLHEPEKTTSDGRVVQVRVQTRDNFVTVTESREDGASIRTYGPFATADEQRAFMRSVWSAHLRPGLTLDAELAAIDTWRRYDEDEDGEEP